MASLLGEQLFQISGQGPPPPKDFFQLVITKDRVEYKCKIKARRIICQVIWTTWNISLRRECRGAPPKQVQTTHQDFLHEKMIQYDVGFVFGERILNYTRSLCQGKFDYLERLPDKILLGILSYLDLKDTTILAQVSHRFRRLCNSEEFWEKTVRNRCPGFTCDMEGIANAMGWRRTFFTFFHKDVIKEEQ